MKTHLLRTEGWLKGTTFCGMNPKSGNLHTTYELDKTTCSRCLINQSAYEKRKPPKVL